MQTMSHSLAALVKGGKVRLDDAERTVSDANELRTLVRGAA
jgi:Tfp pilus assembly ATPase PilU